jgi:hypothetical protein
MDRVPLHSLTKSEAERLLEEFLSIAGREVEETLSEAKRAGLRVNFAITSIGPLMEWAFRGISTVPKPIDETVPEWIAATDSYQRGLFDFDTTSYRIVLRLAFFLGECFIRNYDGLVWSTGRVDTPEANMPVVAGFDHAIEMAPVLVVTNLFRRVLTGTATVDCFEVAVQSWCADSPKRETVS